LGISQPGAGEMGYLVARIDPDVVIRDKVCVSMDLRLL
jgi:hypothetical protein